jgi:hypothetical protein
MDCSAARSPAGCSGPAMLNLKVQLLGCSADRELCCSLLGMLSRLCRCSGLCHCSEPPQLRLPGWSQVVDSA